MSVSYFVQIAVGWSLWLALLHHIIRHRKCEAGGTPIADRAKQLFSIVKSMVANFQEAQCFFTIATQIATITAVTTPNSLTTTTTAQLGADCKYMTIAAGFSWSMIAFGWVMVWFAGLSSGYIHALSLASFGISWPGMFMPLMWVKYLNAREAIFSAVLEVSACETIHRQTSTARPNPIFPRTKTVLLYSPCYFSRSLPRLAPLFFYEFVDWKRDTLGDLPLVYSLCFLC